MRTNVLPYKQAIRQGLSPGAYRYELEEISAGHYEATLDYKVWSTRIMAIHLYFTLATQEKIELSIFPDKRTGRYMLPASELDILTCPTGSVYLLHFSVVGSGKAVLKGMSLIGI